MKDFSAGRRKEAVVPEKPLYYVIASGHYSWDNPYRVRAVFAETAKTTTISDIRDFDGDKNPIWGTPFRVMRTLKTAVKFKTYEDAHYRLVRAVDEYKRFANQISTAEAALEAAKKARETAVVAILSEATNET